MARLLLIRHAKSDWSTALPDHDRPLNARGHRDAPRIGAWIKQNGLTPAQILCSDATRTRETCTGLGLDVPTTYHADLYHADPATLWRYAQTQSDVALIAHNPGIGELIHQLTETPPNHPRFDDIPTATVAAFTLAPTPQLTHFVTPHDLP